MEGKYAKMWYEVSKLVSKCQKEVFNVVVEICRMVEQDIGNVLAEVAKRHNVAYSVEPLTGGGDVLSCVPCVFIQANRETVDEIKKEITSRFPELVSEARLTFQVRPLVKIP